MAGWPGADRRNRWDFGCCGRPCWTTLFEAKRDLFGVITVLLQDIALVSERDQAAMRTLVVAAEQSLS